MDPRKLTSIFFLLLLVLTAFAAGCIEDDDDDDDDGGGGGGGGGDKDLSPVISLSVDKSQVNVNEEVNFTAEDSLGREGANITLYQWSFGDGNSEESENATTTHSFATTGSFNVSLTIKDENNLTNTTWFFVGVFEHLQDSGSVGSTASSDEQNHQHTVLKDTLWNFYHIEMNNEFPDIRDAEVILNFTVDDVLIWNQTVIVSGETEVAEFNITVHEKHVDSGNESNVTWTHLTGVYDLTITAQSGTVNWDLDVMKAFKNGEAKDQEDWD